MSSPEGAVSLRPARDEDRDFLLSLYASTREPELELVAFGTAQREAFLAQQFAARSAHYEKHYQGASFDVVLVDCEPAGSLTVLRRERETVVVDIALLPEQRSRGVGTRLLEPILADADGRGATVTVHVERFNRALALYSRLGFTVTSDNGLYLRLERGPPCQAKTAS